MRVKDLIAALGKLDPELPVMSYRDEGYDGAMLGEVDFAGMAYAEKLSVECADVSLSPIWLLGVRDNPGANDVPIVFVGHSQDVR